MKNFKVVDFWVSVLWISGFTITSIFYSGDGLLNDTLITGYMVVGLWQIISMCVHAIAGYFTRKWGERYIYHWLTFISVVTIPAGSIWFLYFAAPFMAVYYTYMCYRETFIKMKRPLDLLK